MPRRGWNAFRSYRNKQRRMAATRRANRPHRVVRYNPTVPAFVPSWLKNTVRNTTKVVSNGINSLLREINTKRRRSLGETRKSR